MDILWTTYCLKCPVRYIHRVGNIPRHHNLLRNVLRSKSKAISKGQQMNGLLLTQSSSLSGPKDQRKLRSWGNQVRKGAFSLQLPKGVSLKCVQQ